LLGRKQVLLIAKVEFPYAGVSLRVGERFDAPDDHARLLIAIGRAEDAAPTESETDARPLQPSPPKKRNYKRRDMQAES